MSERITSINSGTCLDGHPIPGISEYGRKTRAEMIARYRRHYERQKAEAEAALAVPDGQLKVHTYVGVWAQKGRTEVTE